MTRFVDDPQHIDARAAQIYVFEHTALLHFDMLQEKQKDVKQIITTL